MDINIETLKKVKGIGSKTIERIVEQHNKDKGINGYKSEYKDNDFYKINKDINLWQGDCIKLMEHIPDKSIDLILCDLPYGTTVCSWDKVIPFEPLWSHYKRIIKDNGNVVLFGSEPFSTDLRCSNKNWYRYDWIWKKNMVTGFQMANKRPLKNYEQIMVFNKGKSIYNPQGLKKYGKNVKRKTVGENWTEMKVNEYVRPYTNFPRQVLEFNRDVKSYHSTQKPVKLLEYLIKTYTDENMMVLDNTMGSGSTGVACKNTNRRFIGIELEKRYFDIAKERIND